MRLPLMVLAGVALTLPLAQSAVADDDDSPAVTLQGVEYAVVDNGSANEGQQSSVTSGPDYDYLPACDLPGSHVCYSDAGCVENGEEGLLYDVILAGEVVSQTCVTASDPPVPAQVTPGLVARAFRSLDWPASTLVVQPPGGRTLVNFDTNLYTTNDTPTTRVVTLLGQRVTIEATPTGYTWNHGDGTRTTTSDPGAAYPDLRVTHTYERTGTVSTSVDTTYTGRYRIGGGPWTAIPDTLTVPGDAVGLEIIEASPTLVDYQP